MTVEVDAWGFNTLAVDNCGTSCLDCDGVRCLEMRALDLENIQWVFVEGK